MPIYEFKCKKCGENFEFLCLRSDDEKNAACPSCGGKKTEKLMSCFSSSSSGDGIGSHASASACTPRGGFS